jgi:AcrR family transcriptional regulator
MLYDGLVELIQSTPLNKITVKELVETSNVGRRTFYRHFDEIEDIMRWRSDQVFDDMIQHMLAYIEKHGNESRTMLLRPILRYFNQHSEIIELLIQADRLDIMMASFHRAVAPFKASAMTLFEVDKAFIDYDVTIRIGIVINILVRWIETGKQHPPDELADTLSILIKNMVTLDQLT